MANTIMTAKNTFAEGLIMDFAPDNTQATCMTSALNATLLTANGNEMSLQNDMGNGRVETAFLPEGYIPVGTCEFGDIIYVVSYNPLINKSQIGCFPSPERNISSEEIGGLEQVLTWSDFQAGEGTPNGRLKASSVKKILYDSNNMSSGDKYIIYSEDITSNSKYLSDYGNKSHQHNKFPKLVKIHVVSIEESGKIVYLDSTTKWYSNDFYIHSGGKKTPEGKLDIDSYRTMVSSAYSIFSSKVSGKLALLVELEKITGFSCSWEPYVTKIESGDIEYTTYSIYWNFNWTTDDNNINPNGTMLMESEWTGTNSSKKGQYQLWEYSGSKLGLKSWESADAVPSPFEEGISTLSCDFSRGYKPEQGLTYDDFIKNYEYNSYLNNTLNSLKIKNSYKINLYKEENDNSVLIPKLGNYIINCTETIGSKYYNRSSDGKLIELNPLNINDDIINNYFHYPIVKKFNDFRIPTKQNIEINEENIITKIPNIDNLIYHYKIAPTMPYGILEEFTQEGYIDFSKIGKKNISLNTWKYYNYENTSTLTWGMEAYTEPNKGISEVVFEFYDNQGFVAAYHNKGKLSYNGTFTEYITLNESGSNYKLNNIKAFPDIDIINTTKIEKPTYHKGNIVTKETAVPGFMYFDGYNWIDYSDLQDDKSYYQDDSGTLYSNCLYLVKIIIKYCDKGVLGEYQELSESDTSKIIEDYRWFWTNTMYNDQYYQQKDFNNIEFSLSIDVQAQYFQKKETISNNVLYQGISSDATTEENKNEYQQLKANVTYINQGEDTEDDKNGNIQSQLQVGLVNDYGTFQVSRKSLNKIAVKTYLGASYLENDQIDIISTENLNYVFDGIYPINSVDISTKAHELKIGKSLLSLMGYKESSNSNAEINEKEDSYKNYINTLNIVFPTKNNGSIDSGDDIEYISYNQETKKVNEFYKCWLNEIEYNISTGYIDFTLSGILYSKFYELKSLLTTNVTVIKPLLYNLEDLDSYNMDFKNDHFYFKNVGGLCVGDDGDGDNRTRIKYFKGEVNQGTYNVESFDYLGKYRGGKSAPAYLNQEVQQTDQGTLSQLFPGITPFILIRDDNYGRDYSINAGKDNVDNAKIYPATSGEYYNYFGTFSNPIGEGIRTNFSTASNKNSFMILALNDKEGQLHFLNTYIPVRYLKNSYVSQNIRYGSTGKTYKPQTIGDAVASTLMSLYYTSGLSETTTFLGTYNFIKLNNYNNIYTKDIIYNVLPPSIEEITIDNNHNELILIRSIYFNEYVNSILENKQIDKLKVVCNNVNLNLKGTIKNYPIQFKFPYVTPIQQSVISPKYVIKSSDGKHISTMTGITKDMLYFQDPKNEQSLIRINDNTAFIYNPITDFKYSDTGQFIGTKNSEVTITNNDLGKAFSLYQEQLVCRNTSENISDRSSYTINGKEEKWSGVWPLHRDEVLLPMGKLA